MESALPWDDLLNHYASDIKTQHLKSLLADESRNDKLKVEFDNIILDYSHIKMNPNTVTLLESLVSKSHLFDQIEAMFKGVYILLNN